MAFHVIHYGEVKVLLLDLAAKREWFKIIFSYSERVMHCVTKISALVLTGAHSVSKTKRREVLIGARGCVLHTGLSELFLCMCLSAPVASRTA